MPLKHTAVLRRHLDMRGKRIADIGCGDGGLVRFLTREGAEVTGLEPAQTQLDRAQAAEAAGGEDYLLGRAEVLPFADAALDIVVFFNSLHHVPMAGLGAALGEARRVLIAGGILYVMEPLARGPRFEITRDIEDETDVRAAAYAEIRARVAAGHFVEELEFVYDAPLKYASFEAFKAGVIAVDGTRAPRVAAQEASLRQKFASSSEQRDGAYWMYQPSRLNLLRKA